METLLDLNQYHTMKEHRIVMRNFIMNRINENKRTLVIEFSRTADVRKPKLNEEETFFILYSPESLKIRPCEGSLLNLKIKINLPLGLEAGIRLLPTFITRNLTIKNFEFEKWRAIPARVGELGGVLAWVVC